MTQLKPSNRRRSSSLCHHHQSAKPTSVFCASCLRERLATIEAQSSSIQPPELRRIRSHSVRNPSTALISEQPRRRSCDVRSSATSLHDLFVNDDDDEERVGDSIPEEDCYDEGKPRKIVAEEVDNGEHKTMKEFIDLDWGNPIDKYNGKDLKSVFSRKLKNFSLSKRNVIGRHSCDVGPRLSLDGGRASFVQPRASWDGCLIEKTYHKLTPLSTLTETQDEKSPGGTVQTRNYYSDSRRRRSFDRSMSINRQGLLDVDEFKTISNAMVSPEALGLFHGAKLLVTEKELRDSNWYSIKNHKPESKELGSKGKICIPAPQGKQNGADVKKPKKKWIKGWNIWGLIQRKNEIKNDQSLKLEGNAIEGSLAESLLKLRRVAKGETNGGVSEKLLKSYSVSARKSCDGVPSRANIVTGFEGGRSSCDGLFHGSINSVDVERNSCHGLDNIEGKQSHQRETNTGMCARENLDNSLFRFYLTPTRSQKTSKSEKSRLMT